jgi:hypothetical protein
MPRKRWHGPVDTDGKPCRFLNHYRCSECFAHWSNQWSCQCNDHCPNCGLGDIEPWRSEDIDNDGNIVRDQVSATP